MSNETIEIYKKVLNNELSKFPRNFLKKEENRIDCIKYMIENILGWNDDDIKNKLTAKTFKNNKLLGMIQTIYKGSPYEAINTAYPNKFKLWEFNQVPTGYWNEETAKDAMKWLIEEKFKWNENDIKTKLNKQVFVDNGLNGMLQQVYNNNQYKAINDLYPNKSFKTQIIPKDYWNETTAKETMKWLIEEKLKWNENDIKEKLDYIVFIDNKVSGMLKYYNNSPYVAINTLYPNKFKPWEFKSTPKQYWNKETAKDAMKWLIEEKLQWTDDDIKEKLNQKVFKDNGLKGMLDTIYNYSPYQAINALYPSRFKPWEFKKMFKNYWNEETAKEAVKWLIEEKLQWNDNDIKEKLTAQIFINNKLYPMLRLIYKCDLFKAINEVYPNKFKRTDFYK